MSKAEQANNLPFVPEFQAEGQPFPRVARNADGVVMPRVRKDNGMTKQLQGRGIGKDGKIGLDAYTKRQLALYAEYGIGKDRSATREEYAAHANKGRSVLKDKINEALACERAALARGDVAAAEAARAEVRQLRKAARSKA
jgi:hypothetical protein